MGQTAESAGVPLALLRAMLKSQYHAGLAMFRESVELCPAEQWTDAGPTNAFWQVAYHTLFFTHLYLQPTSEDFRPWHGHDADTQNEDGIGGPPDPASHKPVIPRTYGKEEVLEYCSILDAWIDDAVDALDLRSPTSGFSWYRVSKLEHQVINVRHLQHHTAQLADRVRAAAGVGVRWVGARKPA